MARDRRRLRALMTASNSAHYVCKLTVPKPHLTTFYLRYCADCLCAAGLALHALLAPLNITAETSDAVFRRAHSVSSRARFRPRPRPSCATFANRSHSSPNSGLWLSKISNTDWLGLHRCRFCWSLS